QLAFGSEGQTADAGATVPRGLPDQEETGVLARREIVRETTPQEAGARAFAIEVVGGADLGSGQLLDEAHGSHSDGRRATAARDRPSKRGLARGGAQIARAGAIRAAAGVGQRGVRIATMAACG